MLSIRRLSTLFLTASLLASASCYAEQAKKEPVRMVVTAAFVSDKGLSIYGDLANYVAQKLGESVQVVSGLSYDEADAMLKAGKIQVGFVCGLPYVNKDNTHDYELLAIPVMATKKGDFADAPGYEVTPGKYFSYTIVRKDSPLKSWLDLKGKTYAFNELNSNSGYNMPRYKLVLLGAKSWEDYFSGVVMSGSHEESIRLVARGMVDASSVDSMVLDYDRSIHDPDAMNVRIIETLHPGGAGAPPVVVNPNLDAALKRRIKDVLLYMHEDGEGRAILAKALVKYFAPPDDHNYDDIRHMVNSAQAAGFHDYQTE